LASGWSTVAAQALPQTSPEKAFVTFPGLSLMWSIFTAAGPEIWVVFFFVVTMLVPELGATVLAVTLLTAPLVLPLIAMTGLASTTWFAYRVRKARAVVPIWWMVAFCLFCAHLWHILLSLADAALIASIATDLANQPKPSWNDYFDL
jgi:hypothetical protein